MLARLRSLWRGARERTRVEQEMVEEFRHHLALRTEDLVRGGLSPAAAERQARLEFGHVETHRESARAARGLDFIDRLGFSWLDAKLGMRMVAKYPWLSGVSVLGMAVAIAIGTGAFAVISTLMDPSLPLPGDERIVSLQNNTENPGNPERRALHDFFVWREELRTLRDVSAVLTESRNLIVPGRAPEAVSVARMSPAGFRVAGVRPLLGRTLSEEDDLPGAEPVVVVAYEEWRERFEGRPAILGSTVRLGSRVHTVVGVMPQGFRFPVNHRFWIPLQRRRHEYAPGSGPAVHMFARLADGVRLEQAQAEIVTVGRRLAATYPQTHARLRPRVLPYTHPYTDVDDPFMVVLLHALRVFISLLLVLVAVNVAMLIYARTVARAGEIVVRTALGASRRRIVTQMFVEALVLSASAAAVGVAIAWFGLDRTQLLLERSTGGELPFWLRFRLTPGAALYGVGLAILAGILAGVLPALRATGRNVQAGLQQISSRGSRLALGRTWTAMIVAQVAVAVAIMPFVLQVASESVARGAGRPSYPADRMLQFDLAAEEDATRGTPLTEAERALLAARFGQNAAEVVRRIETEPEVRAVTYASDFPGRGSWDRIEVEGRAGRGFVVTDHVAPNLFSIFEVPVLQGRAFTAADARSGAAVAIVDRTFVERYLGGAPALGRRVREVSLDQAVEPQPEEWLEIVGVVPNFTFQYDFDPANAHVYRPASLEALGGAATLIARTHTPLPATLSARLREHAAAVEPTLLLHRIETVAAADRTGRQALLHLGLGTAAVAVSVLLLSAAGIYAMMSFTVARRRREIGIRSALGADPRRVIGGIFGRALAQLGSGIAGGLVLAALLGTALEAEMLRGRDFLLLGVVACLMTLIGLLAALGPARRSLAIQPTEAFRED